MRSLPRGCYWLDKVLERLMVGKAESGYRLLASAAIT
jgi:hypothetical protein